MAVTTFDKPVGTEIDALSDQIVTFQDVPYSDFTWNSGVSAYQTNQTVSIPTGYSLIGVLVTPTNAAAVMSGYRNSSNYVYVSGWIPLTGASIGNTHTFICKLVLKKS